MQNPRRYRSEGGRLDRFRWPTSNGIGGRFHRNTQLNQVNTMLSKEVLGFISTPVKMLINGQWVEGDTNQTFDVENPADKQIIAEVCEGAAADIDAAVVSARAAFESPNWKRISTAERARMLFKLADLVELNTNTLAELDVISMGKTIVEARSFDGWLAAEMLRYNAGWCTKITGKTSTTTLPDIRGRKAFGTPYHSYTVREPVGVCGIIIPWNAPMVMAIAKMAPALAAGCTVVLKPAELSPLAPLKIGELIEQAGFPKGVVNIVPGFGDIAGDALVRHPDVDKISFTGSTAVGQSIIRTIANDMKRVSLELGGKSPIIVFDDADPEQVIPAATNAIYANCGQICFAGSRLFVHRRHYDQVVDGVAKQADALKVGPGMYEDTQIGPLVSQTQLERVCGYFEGDLDGLEVVTGGSPMSDHGYFFEPSVVIGSNHKSRFFQEEIFGPVLAINSFDEVEEVISMANDSTYGLAAGIFTQNLSMAHQVARELQAGSIWVNGYPVVDLNLPFGGFKKSGWGRENGLEGVESFTEVKTVTMALS